MRTDLSSDGARGQRSPASSTAKLHLDICGRAQDCRGETRTFRAWDSNPQPVGSCSKGERGRPHQDGVVALHSSGRDSATQGVNALARCSIMTWPKSCTSSSRKHTESGYSKPGEGLRSSPLAERALRWPPSQVVSGCDERSTSFREAQLPAPPRRTLRTLGATPIMVASPGMVICVVRHEWTDGRTR